MSGFMVSLKTSLLEGGAVGLYPPSPLGLYHTYRRPKTSHVHAQIRTHWTHGSSFQIGSQEGQGSAVKLDP